MTIMGLSRKISQQIIEKWGCESPGLEIFTVAGKKVEWKMKNFKFKV